MQIDIRFNCKYLPGSGCFILCAIVDYPVILVIEPHAGESRYMGIDLPGTQ
jgi:hypothetical protein